MRKAKSHQFTTVVGIDGTYVHQLEIVLPNWRKYRPQIFSNPMVLFYDARTMQAPMRLAREIGPLCRVVEWDPEGEFESQRHRMLSGHVAVPARHVSTPWWLKVDSDAYAIKGRNWWIDQEALSLDVDWIASAWGYTKPADQMQRLDDWGDTVDELKEFPRLDLPFDPETNKCVHPRMSSWVMFGRTSFAKWAYGLYEGDVCPVPSQDGYHFYCSKRAGRKFHCLKMKRKGWRNVSKTEKLRIAVQETL